MTVDLSEDVKSLMPIYYARLFPFKRFIQWLSYGSSPATLQNREFSFTINHQSQEIYIRFLSFASKAEFKQEIIKKCPEKIDIGAVYSGKPKMKNSLKLFKPVQRELVFDIDMTDYDDIRTCCSGASICLKCWKFMTIALKLLDYALRECFGFKHILYVYSGRRGIHCWICDDRARFLSEEGRKAIVGFLEVIKGGEQKSKKVYLQTPMHPFLQYLDLIFLRFSVDGRSAEKILVDYFETIVLEDQDILSHPEKMAKLLDILPAKCILILLISESLIEVRDEVEAVWAKVSGSRVRWIALKEMVNKSDNKSSVLLTEIMFQYLYPRLDAQVSMHLNHLLKAPFCVHPKTGRICVPIDIKKCEEFNPLDVPTVASLIREINEFDQFHPDEMETDVKKLSGIFKAVFTFKLIQDWKKTSLKKYMATYDEFKQGLDLEQQRAILQKRMAEDEKMQF